MKIKKKNDGLIYLFWIQCFPFLVRLWVLLLVNHILTEKYLGPAEMYYEVQLLQKDLIK